MITKEIRAQRCNDALEILTREADCVFFTLTTPDVVDFPTIRARWRALRHELLRLLRKIYGKGHKVYYVMNYESHPGYLQKVVKDRQTVDKVIRSDGISHGWHIHGVISCYLPLHNFLPLLRRCGFGRFDVRRVTSRGVADYLTKHALKAYKGLSAKERERYKGARRRLVNTSRGLPSLNDYAYHSDLIDATRPIMAEAREIEKVDENIILRLRDYRRVYQRAQVCALLGLHHTWQLSRCLEWLNDRGVDGFAGLLSHLKWRSVFQQADLPPHHASGRKYGAQKRDGFLIRISQGGILSENFRRVRGGCRSALEEKSASGDTINTTSKRTSAQGVFSVRQRSAKSACARMSGGDRKVT